MTLFTHWKCESYNIITKLCNNLRHEQIYLWNSLNSHFYVITHNSTGYHRRRSFSLACKQLHPDGWYDQENPEYCCCDCCYNLAAESVWASNLSEGYTYLKIWDILISSGCSKKIKNEKSRYCCFNYWFGINCFYCVYIFHKREGSRYRRCSHLQK